jgi:hypothetical protein
MEGNARHIRVQGFTKLADEYHHVGPEKKEAGS